MAMNEKNADRKTSVEIDLRKLFAACLRKAWLIVAFAVAAALLGWYWTANFVTPMYEANIRVYVNSIKTGQQIDSISSGSLATAQRLVLTYVEMIKSDTVLEKVAEAAEEGITAKEIRRSLSAAQVGETELFDVIITHSDPEKAAHIANAMAAVAPAEIERFVEGSSAKIIDYAKVPATPASPNVFRNVVFSAFLGGVAAVALLTLQFLMDVRIKEEEDLQAIFDIPVLGQIPEFDAVNVQKSSGYRRYGYGHSASMGGASK